MSANFIAALARSPENMKCPLLATIRHVTVSVRKSNIFKVFVQNAVCMLECKVKHI